MRTWNITEKGTLREAQRKDTALVLGFIKGLAEYEHLEHMVEATEEMLARYFFDEKKVEVLICEYEGKAVGFALFFHNFSTFLGKPGLYIEDIYIEPEYRGKGLGKGMLTTVAQIAVERDYGRVEWACLDWNEPSIRFYKSQGAVPMDEWTIYRVTGENLQKLGAKKV
ncbi:MAG: GNAT family N-acetyltransferase [Fusobacteriaceae bacterium]|jgi:GNAT superfamily N-acetyltransferase|nr:GNAT family N-acetyltransferase [Fusobacteriaceae bacterium]